MTEEQIENLRRFAVRKAHQMLPADEAEDAAQEAMLQISRTLPRLDESRDPWPLLALVIRQALSRYSRDYYAKRTEPLPDPEALQAPSTEDLALSHLGHGESLSPRILAALETLPVRQREILEAGVMAGRTNVAAAEALGVSEARVRTATARALTTIRETLEAAA